MARKIIYECPGKTPRHHKGYSTTPAILDELGQESSFWHESPVDRAEALHAGLRREALLGWVRAQMYIEFNSEWREAIQLYYFAHLSFRDIAKPLGLAPSTVMRRTEAGIHELRKRAVACGLRQP